MTPEERYASDLAAGVIQPDPCQEQAIACLQRCYDQLLVPVHTTWLQRFAFARQKHPLRQGLYLWGCVGRGKTYLMDCFFNALPFSEKKRLHFHRFMHQVYTDLQSMQARKNPLEILARQWCAQTRVLCFDEFFVSDIGDAMLLGGLMTQLFQHGVMLVATSNVPPDDLYRNGLQRENFLPAIAHIKQHCQVFRLHDGQDYRLRKLEQAELYYDAKHSATTEALQTRFRELVGEHALVNYDSIEVNQRIIPVLKESHGVLWISFHNLCASPRSSTDYIEISKCYHTVLLSDVMVMGPQHEDVARRFIALVDEFYERHVKLILAAHARMTDLYSGQRLAFEFQRCLSRLQEMQSHDYLKRPHHP